MADANGIDNQDIVLSMPVDSTLMRYFKDGVIPFCVNNNNGIDIQVKDGALGLTVQQLLTQPNAFGRIPAQVAQAEAMHHDHHTAPHFAPLRLGVAIVKHHIER